MQGVANIILPKSHMHVIKLCRATTPVAGSNGGHPGRRRRLSSDSIVSRISPTLQEEDETSKQASLIANSGFKLVET